MLFDVAALLFTSGPLGQAAEAFGVPAHTGVSVVETVDAAALDPLLGSSSADSASPPASAEDPSTDVSVAGGAETASTRSTLHALANSTGLSLLTQLSRVPESTSDRFVATRPDGLVDLLRSPPATSAVASWWSRLDRTERMALVGAAPEVIGNLDGVPFTIRNVANRSVLAATIERLQDRVDSGVGRAELGGVRHTLESLRAIDEALGDERTTPSRYLLSLDPTGDTTAAISIGNPQSADYVSFLIPGMFFGVGAQIGEWTDTAARLYDDQVSWLRLFQKAGAADASETVATVAWIGYQTPHLLNVGSEELAEEGRIELTGIVEGLQSARGDDQPYLSILAHSYGSTAALMSLTEDDFEVDALALVGSPGSAAQSVDDLHVRGGNVFVGEAAWDPIPNSSYFGSDPGTESYGAKPMSVSGGVDVITNEVLAASTGHNEYFGPGTESLRNLALIAIDRGEFVTDGSAKDRDRTLARVG